MCMSKENQTELNEFMQKKQIETENGYIDYKIKNNKAIITGFQGNAARIRLPAQIEGCPVATVERKAFLSSKSLYAVSFPDSMEEVGDWAFAHCDNLTELTFPGREVRFGRAVFKNCGKLNRILIRKQREVRPGAGDSLNQLSDTPGDSLNQLSVALENSLNQPSGISVISPNQPSGIPADAEQQPSATPELLAATVTMLDAYYLLDLQRAGTSEWLEKWDTKLQSVLHTPDQEGYISQSVYGEEDYIGTDLEEYISERRREKVRLAYLRLLHPQALPPALKEELETYLRSLTKGQPGEEAWLVLKQEHSSHSEYYKLFANLRCITEDNCDAILEDIGEDNPEMKAFFLKHRQEQREGTADFFESLEL